MTDEHDLPDRAEEEGMLSETVRENV
jgi:hypothetical protein